MIRTLFVLDFDGTYSNEDEHDLGVAPLVYLVPLHRILDVERAADDASTNFHTFDNNDTCIGDYFEQILAARGIEFQQVGELKIPFGQRQEDYLDDAIHRSIV